jgi:redox-sensitive bicupin YhaK (pirin superfamily)
MNQRPIVAIHPAVRDDIADLTTFRALPTHHVEMVDPFLFLNHHGPQVYPPHNRGLPFGPHPHRGFETVTFILDGDIAHRDSGGHESIIESGGMQWMTAGSGLVHSETSSAAFKARGGPLEVLQLWVNLPAALKMTAPRYIGLQADRIPVIDAEGGSARIGLVAGEWNGHRGPVDTLTDIAIMTIALDAGAHLWLPVGSGRNVFFYVVRGSVRVNGTQVARRHLVAFSPAVEADGAASSAVDTIEVDADADAPALILFGHAAPFREPVVSHGPFVMNTRAEIAEAIADYQAGKFGG